MRLFVQLTEWFQKQLLLYKISTVTKLSATLHNNPKHFLWFGSLVSKLDLVS